MLEIMLDEVRETVLAIWLVILYFVLSFGMGVVLPVAVAYYTLRFIGAI